MKVTFIRLFGSFSAVSVLCGMWNIGNVIFAELVMRNIPQTTR